MRIFIKYARLLRVKHYIKNLLIFLPVFFSGELYLLENIISGIKGFALFSIASSVIYIFNDLRDIQYDKQDAHKSKRPVASGEVAPVEAFTICIVLAVMEVMLNILFHETLLSVSFVCLYIFLNVFYSLKGKHIPIIDVCLLSIGYPLRIFYGGIITGTCISHWLFLTVFSLSMYFAYGKRFGEILNGQRAVRPVLKQYAVGFLEHTMYLCSGMAIMSYSLWTIEKSEILVYTVPFVIVLCMIYNFYLYKRHNGDPVELLMSATPLSFAVLIYIVVMVLIFLFL